MSGAAGAVYRAPREWTRLHPVSPFLGGWTVVGGIGAIWLYNSGPSWVVGDDPLPDEAHLPIIALLVGGVLVLALVVGLAFLGWRFNQFKVDDEAVHQRKGVVFRQYRQARLDRLQAVDVVQPLLARIFGFAAIRIEVAGGENSGVALEYLRLGDAEALRNEIVALASGVKRAKATGEDPAVLASRAADAVAAGADVEQALGTTDAPAPSLHDLAPGADAGVPETAAAPERPMYSVPLGRLFMSVVLSWPFVFLATVALGFAVSLAWFGSRAIDAAAGFLAAFVGSSLITALPALFAFAGYFFATINRGFNFTAGISEDGIRLRHGLLETRRQTVPPGRVQAVRLQQSLLWRRKDWWQITINVAGYQDDQAAVSTLLPVGTRQEALTALWLVLPDLGDPDPASTISQAMSGTGGEGGFTPSPSRSRWFDLVQWRQRGVRATDRALLVRRGRLVKQLFVVPHERTQSLAITQGPLERALRLANVQVHSTKGPVAPIAHHLDVEDAAALLEAQAARAREGRSRQTPEQWMSAVGLT